MTDAPLTPTSLPPPSVTNVNGEPAFAHWGGTLWVTTLVGSPPGGFPPHAPARSNVLRPTSVAPVVVHVSRRRSALARETLNPYSSVGDRRNSVSPAATHAWIRSTWSFGPATKPSSDMPMNAMTLPTAALTPRARPRDNAARRDEHVRDDLAHALSPPRVRCQQYVERSGPDSTRARRWNATERCERSQGRRTR